MGFHIKAVIKRNIKQMTLVRQSGIAQSGIIVNSFVSKPQINWTQSAMVTV